LAEIEEKAEGFGMRRLESSSCSVFPAEAGIQAGFELAPKTNLDAGVRRHDEASLRLSVS